MVRNILAIALAVVASFSFQWHRAHSCSAFAYIGFEAWSPMLLMDGDRMMTDLLPGLIVGALLRSHQVVAGSLVSVVCGLATHAFISHYCYQEWLSAVSAGVTALQCCVYGAAGAALGYVVQARFVGGRRWPVI